MRILGIHNSHSFTFLQYCPFLGIEIPIESLRDSDRRS